MKAANLLPPDRRGARRKSAGSFLAKRPLPAVAIVLALLATALLGFLTYSARTTAAKRTDTVAQLDRELAKLAPKPDQSSAQTALASRLSAVTAAGAARNSWDGFLWALSRVMPEDVWLLSLQGSLPTPSTTTPASTPASTPAPASTAGSTSSGFTLTGYTYSQPSVARLMRRLTLLPWLNGVSLVTSSKTTLGKQTVYQFTVGATLIKLPEVGS